MAHFDSRNHGTERAAAAAFHPARDLCAARSWRTLATTVLQACIASALAVGALSAIEAALPRTQAHVAAGAPAVPKASWRDGALRATRISTACAGADPSRCVID